MGDVDVQPHVLRFGFCSLVGCQFTEARNTTFHIVHYINSTIQKGGVILGVRRSNQGQIWGPIKKTVTAVVWSYEPRNLYMTKIEWSV